MNNLYEVLETCLQEIEQGADIDTVLFRYPDLADELRPILEASRNASSMAVPAPSAEVVRRNRAKVLQRAAEMREATARQASRRFWFVSFRRLVVTLTVVSILFVSGTGLVSASSTTLPGDHLYPVKRTWEDVLVLFTFNSQQRNALEVEHENERLHELKEVFAQRRSADVEFAGLVTSQNGNEWTVGGIPVVISPQTKLHGQDLGIGVGSAVRVEGHTQDNGAVLAEEIKLLPPDAKLPDAEEEQEHEKESAGDQDEYQQVDEDLSERESPKIEVTKTPRAGSQQEGWSPRDGSDDDSGSDNHSDDSDSGDSKDNEDDHKDDHHDGDSEGGDSSSDEDGD